MANTVPGTMASEDERTESRIRRLLASIHDVSPRFEGAIDRLADLMATGGAERLAMLVIPNHWGDAPIRPGSPFAGRLRRWSDAGIEMFLHGWYHRDTALHASALNRLRARFLTAREGEFLGMPEEAAVACIEQGRALLQDVTGRGIAGFIAPAWLYGPGARAALQRTGVALAEDHWRIWSPASGRTIARGPVVTWATRTRPRQWSSLAVAAAVRRYPPARVMRLAVHPPDTRSPPVLASIASTLAALSATHRPSSYTDLARDAAW